mgnify:FL=1
MKILIANDTEEFDKLGANVVKEVITSKPDAVIGFATGSTPVGAYQKLIEYFNNGEISFKDVTTFNLDEYVGLEKTHDQSYFYFMQDKLFGKVDIDQNKVNFLSGTAKDVTEECRRYDTLLEKNPIDLQILGIGANGHIGFNEPNTPFNAVTREVTLTQKTIQDNARFFASEDEVPKSAVTMGMVEIMASKKIVLMANGKNKADAVYNMIKGEVSLSCPASILQLHNDVTVILDKDSASKLN